LTSKNSFVHSKSSFTTSACSQKRKWRPWSYVRAYSVFFFHAR